MKNTNLTLIYIYLYEKRSKIVYTIYSLWKMCRVSFTSLMYSLSPDM